MIKKLSYWMLDDSNDNSDNDDNGDDSIAVVCYCCLFRFVFAIPVHMWNFISICLLLVKWVMCKWRWVEKIHMRIHINELYNIIWWQKKNSRMSKQSREKCSLKFDLIQFDWFQCVQLSVCMICGQQLIYIYWCCYGMCFCFAFVSSIPEQCKWTSLSSAVNHRTAYEA